MICRFCGKENIDTAKFCGFCGKAVEPVPERKPVTWTAHLHYYLLGVLFIAGSIWLALYPQNYEDYSSALDLVAREGAAYLIALSSLSAAMNFLVPLFNFATVALSFYVGLLLLKKAANVKKALITCAVVHGLSLVYSLAAGAMVYNFPRWVVSWFSDEKVVLAVADEVLEDYSWAFDPFLEGWIGKGTISLVMVGGVAIFLFIQKQQKEKSAALQKVEVTGNLWMLLSLAVLTTVGNLWRSIGIYRLLSVEYYGIYTYAVSVFNSNFRLYAVLIIAVSLLVAVLCSRALRKTISPWAALMIALLGGISFIYSGTTLMFAGQPREWVDFGQEFLKCLVVGMTLLLIALHCWFNAVALGNIPTWLQMLWPVALPAVYVGTEYVARQQLALPFTGFWGIYGIALVTLLLGLIVRKRI